MKKSMLYTVILLLFFCFSVAHASEDNNADDSKSGAEIKPPDILNTVTPGYPIQAEADHVEGFVTIKFTVTKEGNVENPEIVEAVPPDYFETSTINALMKYKFKPATHFNVPVDYTLEWPFVFSFPGTTFTGDIKSKLQTYRYTNNGRSLIQEGQYQNAADEISKAIKLEPDYGTAYYYRSLALSKMEEYEKAIPDIDRAIESTPDVFGYYNHRGLIYLYLENYQKAIEDFNKSIQIEPSNIFAFMYRGDTYRQSGKYQEAIEDYSSALALNDGLIHLLNNRGYTYYKLKENDKACTDFKKSCELGDCRAYEHLKERGVCSSDISGFGD